MKKMLLLLICGAILWPPMAVRAEDASHKFKVHLRVSAAEPIKTVVENYVRRELVRLGDVALVDANEDYHIAVAVAQNPDIRSFFSFATVFMEKSAWGLLFKNMYAHFSMPDQLKLTSRDIVANFDRQILAPLRAIGSK